MIYHVTQETYDGDDLLSQQVRVNRGWADEDDHRWDEIDFTAYLNEDGCEVHFHDSLEDAEEFRAEYAPQGSIVVVDPEVDGEEPLDVDEGKEYPHPVVRWEVPARYVVEVI